MFTFLAQLMPRIRSNSFQVEKHSFQFVPRFQLIRSNSFHAVAVRVSVEWMERIREYATHFSAKPLPQSPGKANLYQTETLPI